MPLSAGTKLGAYSVLSQIGAGGMGEVYQAHDSNLRRDVAIKVLPESFAHDADRLSRFRREAQLLASLNHRNDPRTRRIQRHKLPRDGVGSRRDAGRAHQA